MKNYWFSSDWHLSHANVLRYDNRPFENVKEMDATIIENYNALVADNDDFYFLGDFCFNNKHAYDFLAKLKGNLYFIKGNHDKSNTIKLYEKFGVYLGEQKRIRINDQDIVLNHFAMQVWDKMHYGAWHLYGHSHGSLPDNQNALKFDVGCMLFDYKPIDFNTVKSIMENKKFKPIDHHNTRR